ncbi:MAG: hypothetical protein ACUVUG_04620 [Candidatus Aminicenantia bacterium]
MLKPVNGTQGMKEKLAKGSSLEKKIYALLTETLFSKIFVILV